MRLHDLLAGLAGLDGRDVAELRAGPGAGIDAIDVRSVVHDSREVGAGALFCCIRGARADGHDFAAEAVAAGAVALLVEEWLPIDVAQARVPSVRRVIGPISARFQGEPSRAMRVLGVTGTNGKTTTTYLLESIARAAGDRSGVIGTVSARIGERSVESARTTPEAPELQALLAEMRDDGVATVAMEVSSHALDQHRVDGTIFAATCFTNLSHDHLDYHPSLDAYFDAKSRLFSRAFTRRAAVHSGDPRGDELAARASAAGVEVARFAIGPDPAADVVARDVETGPAGTAFTLAVCAVPAVPVRTGLVGRFNVVNCLAAATTALLGGYDLDAVVRGLERSVAVPGRMERVDAGQDFTVVVDYAHTPDALAVVLDAARALTAREPHAGSVFAVFGCGGDRDREKRPQMGELAATLADRVFVTSDNPRSEDPDAIIAEILAGVPAGAARSRVTAVADRRAAIRSALDAARGGDVVVIAGKGHETYQDVAGVRTPFDDRVVAREELGR